MAPLDTPPRARPGAPDFGRDGTDWPHRAHSRFWPVDGITWHVQRFGAGPTALLLHGTGAATHSFMDLAPRMAETHDVIAIDLPGHGFTQSPAHIRPSLETVTRRIAALLDALNAAPDLMIGHSAGAAIMLALADHMPTKPSQLVSLNGALSPFPGLTKFLFPAAAQLLTVGGVTAHLMARSARNRSRVLALLEQTGGAPDDRFVDRYWRLLQAPAHVSGTLRLMANWDLSGMDPVLARTQTPVLFLTGSQDQAVDPGDADRLARLSPLARTVRLDRLGHLAHEQDAGRVWTTLEAERVRGRS
ncbi:MAG: alpha/beta fold hydrolase BchO [Pseudomonadota bacterium]